MSGITKSRKLKDLRNDLLLKCRRMGCCLSEHGINSTSILDVPKTFLQCQLQHWLNEIAIDENNREIRRRELKFRQKYHQKMESSYKPMEKNCSLKEKMKQFHLQRDERKQYEQELKSFQKVIFDKEKSSFSKENERLKNDNCNMRLQMKLSKNEENEIILLLSPEMIELYERHGYEVKDDSVVLNICGDYADHEPKSTYDPKDMNFEFDYKIETMDIDCLTRYKFEIVDIHVRPYTMNPDLYEKLWEYYDNDTRKSCVSEITMKATLLVKVQDVSHSFKWDDEK